MLDFNAKPAMFVRVTSPNMALTTIRFWSACANMPQPKTHRGGYLRQD